MMLFADHEINYQLDIKQSTMKSQLSFCFLLVTFLLISDASSQNRIIEITTSNIQLVLKSTSNLYLLFHDAQCPHSHTFVSKFMDINTTLNLGITDCINQKQLCQHFNISHFPSLAYITSKSLNFIDEQQFLYEHKLISQNSSQLTLNRIVSYLKAEPNFVILILEEQLLEVIDKISHDKIQKIFYINNPSQLHKVITNFVNGRLGCWVFKYTDKGLEKYYCGSGYNSYDILKYIQSYEKGTLSRHIFTQDQANNLNMQYTDFSLMVQNLNKTYQKCKLVYFHSKKCQTCSEKNVKNIQKVITERGMKSKLSLHTYDLDKQQLPFGYKIRRVPELVQFCNGDHYEFGYDFTMPKIQQFLTRDRKAEIQKRQLSKSSVKQEL